MEDLPYYFPLVNSCANCHRLYTNLYWGLTVGARYYPTCPHCRARNTFLFANFVDMDGPAN